MVIVVFYGFCYIKSSTTAVFWAYHKRNTEMAEKYFSPPHIYSISWPLTTENDPT